MLQNFFVLFLCLKVLANFVKYIYNNVYTCRNISAFLKTMLSLMFLIQALCLYFQERCLKALCSHVRRLDNETCLKEISTMAGVTYDAYFRLFPTTFVTLDTSLNSSNEVVQWIKHSVDRQFSTIVSIKCSTIEVSHTIRFEDVSLLKTNGELLESVIEYIDVRFETYIADMHDPERIYKIFQPLNKVEIQLEYVPFAYRVYLRDSITDVYIFREFGFTKHVSSDFYNDAFNDIKVGKMHLTPDSSKGG